MNYSLYSIRKECAGGHSVLVLAIDGKPLVSFIGWMQHTQPDLLSLNGGSQEMVSAARALAGLSVDMRYAFASAIKARAAALFARQQTVAHMMHSAIYTKALQDCARYDAFAARCATDDAMKSGIYESWDSRDKAILLQERAARRFSQIAGTRGLFDTPCMDDAHAVECEVSRVESAASVAAFKNFATKYRERAYNAYGRYAMYCARASVSPYAFPEWLTDLYIGNEYDPAANWN